jgi:hypothetical protein
MSGWVVSGTYAGDGEPIRPIGIRAHGGREIGWHDLAWKQRDRWQVGAAWSRENQSPVNELPHSIDVFNLVRWRPSIEG